MKRIERMNRKQLAFRAAIRKALIGHDVAAVSTGPAYIHIDLAPFGSVVPPPVIARPRLQRRRGGISFAERDAIRAEAIAQGLKADPVARCVGCGLLIADGEWYQHNRSGAWHSACHVPQAAGSQQVRPMPIAPLAALFAPPVIPQPVKFSPCSAKCVPGVPCAVCGGRYAVKVGDQIKLRSKRNLYTVQRVSPGFALATRPLNGPRCYAWVVIDFVGFERTRSVATAVPMSGELDTIEVKPVYWSRGGPATAVLDIEFIQPCVAPCACFAGGAFCWVEGCRAHPYPL